MLHQRCLVELAFFLYHILWQNSKWKKIIQSKNRKAITTNYLFSKFFLFFFSFISILNNCKCTKFSSFSFAPKAQHIQLIHLYFEEFPYQWNRVLRISDVYVYWRMSACMSVCMSVWIIVLTATAIVLISFSICVFKTILTTVLLSK